MLDTVSATDQHFNISVQQCVICTSREEAFDMLASVIDEAALDFETTALDPKDGRIRLTSICNNDVHFVIDHDFLGDFAEYRPYMEGKIWWVYNAKFETRWTDYGFTEDDINKELDIRDVDFKAKAVIGGHPSALAVMAKRDLKITLDKTDQNSDWNRPQLTTSQLNYAGFDSYVTWQLKKHWDAEQLAAEIAITEAGFPKPNYASREKVFNDAVRATTEAERVGMQLDSPYHSKLCQLWRTKQATYERYLRKFTPEKVIPNLRSNAQLGKFFMKELDKSVIDAWPRTEKTKQMQMESAFLRSLGRRLPYPFNRWVAALVGFRYYDKYLSTYGEKLITKQNLAGKVTSRFNIAQAATGRYSSSDDNLQNIPRKVVVRKSFHSPKRGSDLMVLADYKGVEVRTLAELSGDKQLIHDAVYSDVHAASCAALYYDNDLDYVLKVLGDHEHKDYRIVKPRRSIAKGFTFQLTYGAGPGALAEVLRCDFEQAIVAIEKWAGRYPNAYGYRNKMFDMMNITGYLPVCDGGTIKVWRNDRTMPVASNYPIQGAAASVMYRAMHRVRRLWLENDVDAVICATVHDELLGYAHKDHAERAMELQLEGMAQGWLDIFPGTTTDNLVDWAIGTTWADKP